jgi:hypothetical protein
MPQFSVQRSRSFIEADCIHARNLGQEAAIVRLEQVSNNWDIRLRVNPGTRLTSGNYTYTAVISALGHRRTRGLLILMSALTRKADIRSMRQHVCFGPLPDSCTAANSVLIQSPHRLRRAGQWVESNRELWPF